jgi:hypothetical protein
MESSADDPLLQQLLYCKGKMDTLTCRGLQELLYLCVNDDTICRYVYNMKPHSYQYARYSDWFWSYANDQLKHIVKCMKANPTVSSFYEKRKDILIQIFELYKQFDEKVKAYANEEFQAMKANMATENFKGTQEVFMGYTHPEVIRHWPPQYIISKEVGQAKVIAMHKHD